MAARWPWPQPGWPLLLGAWALAGGACLLAPYLAALLGAWRYRRVLTDPRTTDYERKLALFERDREAAARGGRARWGVILCTGVALAGALAPRALPHAGDAARAAAAGACLAVALWALWSAARVTGGGPPAAGPGPAAWRPDRAPRRRHAALAEPPGRPAATWWGWPTAPGSGWPPRCGSGVRAPPAGTHGQRRAGLWWLLRPSASLCR